MVFLDSLVANVALPQIQADFGVGESGLQSVVTGFSVGMAVSMMAGATAADRFGRRRVYVASTLVFAAASVAVGLAPNVTVMTVGRALQGIAGAAVIVAALALLSATFLDSGDRAKAIGFWTGVATAAMVLAPPVGGLLTENVGWRSVFLVNVPISLVALALTARHVVESREQGFQGFDWVGQVLFAVAIGATAFGIIEGPKAGWASPEVATLLVVGAVAVAAFCMYEFRRPHPMMDIRLFGNSTYTTAIVAMLATLFGVNGAVFVLTQYFQNVEGYSPERAGLLFLPYAVPYAVLSPVAGRLTAAWGPLRVARSGQTVLALSLAAIAMGMSVSLIFIAAGLFFAGIAVALLTTPVTALAMGAVADDRCGMASGILNAQRGIGSAFGYAIVGSILALYLGGTLEADLAAVVPDPAARRVIAERIIDEATPYAYTQAPHLGPGRPLPEPAPGERAAIVNAARQDFIRGSQLSIVAAVAFCVLSAAMLWVQNNERHDNRRQATDGHPPR